jgi:hypothetical protein
MRVLLLAVAMALSLALLASPAFAANPHTSSPTGPPNQSCEDQVAQGGSQPPGFTNSAGFANAQSNYNPRSQYDVACYQVSH